MTGAQIRRRAWAESWLRIWGRLRRAPVRCAIFAVELYRTYVSPLRLPTCRFTPTCSQYAVEALTEYGLVRGGWLASVRLLKCGPWHRGGWDPVPERAGEAGPGRRFVDDVRSDARV